MEKQINNFNKEDAINILDRTIGFVNNCDTKTSAMLAIFGVIITVICTSDGINEIRRILGVMMAKTSFCSKIHLLLLGFSLIVFVFGLYKLISVLRAKINCGDMKQDKLDLDSKIFFGGIANNKSYVQYKSKLLKSSEDDLLNDIISQIYINAKICTIKFESYNLGLLLSTIGFVAFLTLWIIGSIIF